MVLTKLKPNSMIQRRGLFVKERTLGASTCKVFQRLGFVEHEEWKHSAETSAWLRKSLLGLLVVVRKERHGGIYAMTVYPRKC